MSWPVLLFYFAVWSLCIIIFGQVGLCAILNCNASVWEGKSVFLFFSLSGFDFEAWPIPVSWGFGVCGLQKRLGCSGCYRNYIFYDQNIDCFFSCKSCFFLQNSPDPQVRGGKERNFETSSPPFVPEVAGVSESLAVSRRRGLDGGGSFLRQSHPVLPSPSNVLGAGWVPFLQQSL